MRKRARVRGRQKVGGAPSASRPYPASRRMHDLRLRDATERLGHVLDVWNTGRRARETDRDGEPCSARVGVDLVLVLCIDEYSVGLVAIRMRRRLTPLSSHCGEVVLDLWGAGAVPRHWQLSSIDRQLRQLTSPSPNKGPGDWRGAAIPRSS